MAPLPDRLRKFPNLPALNKDGHLAVSMFTPSRAFTPIMPEEFTPYTLAKDAPPFSGHPEDGFRLEIIDKPDHDGRSDLPLRGCVSMR